MIISSIAVSIVMHSVCYILYFVTLRVTFLTWRTNLLAICFVCCSVYVLGLALCVVCSEVRSVTLDRALRSACCYYYCCYCLIDSVYPVDAFLPHTKWRHVSVRICHHQSDY